VFSVGFVVDEAALGYFLSEYFGFLVAVTVPQVLTIDSSIMRGMDNGSVRGAVPRRNCSTRPRENERNTLEWTDSLRIEHRGHAKLLDQYVTRRVGLNSFRCYTLFKMLPSRVWPVGLAVIHCHKFIYSICCLAVITQFCFRKHISITSSF
jgi:hypothetical protein